MSDAPEQRNAYKGFPARCWIRVRLSAPDGSTREMTLLADTGSPLGVVIGRKVMSVFQQGWVDAVETNFGRLEGGWLRVVMPEFGLDHYVAGYANDQVMAVAKASSPDFEGLAGLPLLRLAEYGGDADSFWFRPARRQP